MGCKMKKVGPCNFGIPQLKNFLKKVLIDKIYMFLGHEKKNWYRALLSPQKWTKVHYLAFFEERRPESKNCTTQISLRIQFYSR